MSSPDVKIYTDGSCSPNPGPGGWGAVLLFKNTDRAVELSGREELTTNNRMELTAAFHGLNALCEPCTVEIYTDSRYLQKGIAQWLEGWKRNGWITVDGSDVKNRDLWEELTKVISKHQVRWCWIKGHSNNTWNDRADRLAAQARRDTPDNDSGRHDGVLLYPGVTWKNSTGAGSWSAILQYGERRKILGGFSTDTTANRLYLTAVIEGIKALKRPLPVFVFTRSGYVRDGLAIWLDGWRKRGWLTREGVAVSNKKEWQELYRLQKRGYVEIIVPPDTEPPCHMQEAKEIAREFEQK